MDFLPIEVEGKKVYAGFWKRFCAAIVDMFVLVPLGMLTMYLGNFNLFIVIALIFAVINVFIYSTYNVYFHYKFGATLGKMGVKIKVAQKDGSKINFKQAYLRSIVDIGIAILMGIAQVVALLKVDFTDYASASFFAKAIVLMPHYPKWYYIVMLVMNLWMWSEVIVILFNKRKRAIHDYIAGTVVIKKEFSL